MATVGEFFINVDVNEELAEIAAALLTIWLNFENGRSLEVVRKEDGNEKVVLYYNKQYLEEYKNDSSQS